MTNTTKNEVSKCCHAKAYVDTADEGTSCYMCEKCGKPCDVTTKNDKPVWPKNKEIDIASHRLNSELAGYETGWNSAIDQCNACVAGIREDDFIDLIRFYCDGPYSVTEDGTDANGKTYAKFAAAIVKHLKERLS